MNLPIYNSFLAVGNIVSARFVITEKWKYILDDFHTPLSLFPVFQQFFKRSVWKICKPPYINLWHNSVRPISLFSNSLREGRQIHLDKCSAALQGRWSNKYLWGGTLSLSDLWRALKIWRKLAAVLFFSPSTISCFLLPLIAGAQNGVYKST